MKRARLALAALALLAAPVAVAQLDGSGTITTGGTSQQVFDVRPGRAYLFCQNPIAATETLFVNAPTVAGTTNGSYELAPGGAITFAGGGFVPTGQVFVTAATTGHRFVCKQG